MKYKSFIAKSHPAFLLKSIATSYIVFWCRPFGFLGFVKPPSILRAIRLREPPEMYVDIE